MLNAANSIEDDSFSEMKVEHESVGRKLIYKGDVLNADDTQNLNKAMFNHHKKETKDFFKRKKKFFYLMTKAILAKAWSGKVLHTEHVIPYPR